MHVVRIGLRAVSAHRTLQRTVGTTVIQRRVPCLPEERGKAFFALPPYLILT